ncbi:hypothetical protein FQR65_LT10380 [Abscondita terminalis]|nr:hypothetical protein FQR65_LT10380 [Abscondita terminalis]
MGEVEYHIVDNVIYTSNLDDNQNSKGLGHNYYSDMMKYKNNTAQIDGITKEEDTFGSLLQRSVRTALAMIDRGIKPGDHISMCTNNHLNSAVPFIASYFTGSVMGAIEPAMSVRDAIYLLQQTLPKIIFAVPSAVPMVEEVAENIGGDPMIVVFGETSRHTPFSQFILPHENEDKFKPYEPDSLDTTSLIVFSSGTSGMPKGICLSQSNMLSFSEEVTMDFGNVLYSIANPYWSVFPVFLHVSVVYGGARVVYPSFDVNEPWTLFYQHVDVAFLNSVQALQMTRSKIPDNADLKNVKLLYVGGSPLTLNQINEIQSVLPHTMVTNSYSQSELFKHCFDVIPFESEFLKNNKLSVGTIQKGVSYKVADVDSGTALGPNQIGLVSKMVNLVRIMLIAINPKFSFDIDTMATITNILIIYLQVVNIHAFTHTNFYINNFEDCDPQNRSKISYRLYSKGGFQYLDFDVTFPIVLDSGVGARFIVEATIDERQYTQLISTYEKNYCLALQRYGGEFWHDFQRSMQISPGVCPIPKRHYKVINHKLNFSNIAVQTFPFGKLRVTVKVMENLNQNVVMCLKFVLDNKTN